MIKIVTNQLNTTTPETAKDDIEEVLLQSDKESVDNAERIIIKEQKLSILWNSHIEKWIKSS